MAVFAALALSTTLASAASCEWRRGAPPARQDEPAVQVERLQALSPESRAALARKIRSQRPDDTVVVARDGITGRQAYEAALRDMQ